MTFYKASHLVRHLRPAESDYGLENALIALPVCRVSPVSQDLLLIYCPAPSAQTNITRHLRP